MTMAVPARRVIVTRPAQEAGRWVDALQQAGIAAVALPLIAIEALEDAAPLRAAQQHIAEQAALMFVSAAAVRHFFDGGAPLPTGTRCWATGPGTARALRQAGIPAAAIDTPSEDAVQFDSEALWAIVAQQVRPGMRLLIVRGGDAGGLATGRDWLARELGQAGGVVQTVVAYRRLAPVLDAAQRRLADEGAAGQALWLFSSSEAIGNLCRALPGQRWADGRAVATHARIADAARDAGFGTVHSVAPGLPALVASIESLA